MTLAGEAYAQYATSHVRVRAVSKPGVYGSSLKLHCTQHSSHCMCNELSAGSLPVMLLTAHLNHFAPFPLKKLHLHELTHHTDLPRSVPNAIIISAIDLSTHFTKHSSPSVLLAS